MSGSVTVGKPAGRSRLLIKRSLSAAEEQALHEHLALIECPQIAAVWTEDRAGRGCLVTAWPIQARYVWRTLCLANDRVVQRSPGRVQLRLRVCARDRRVDIEGTVSLDEPQPLFIFLLNPLCRRLSCVDDGGRALAVYRNGPLALVDLKHDQLKLHLRYEVPTRHVRNAQVILLTSGGGWLMQVLWPDTTCLGTLVVEATRPRAIVTNAEPTEGGWSRFHRADDLVVLFLDDAAARLQLEIANSRLISQTGTERLRGGDCALEVESLLQFYRRFFPPVRRLTIVECPHRECLAFSHPGLITLDPRLLAYPGTLLGRFLPHEMAHQWIGNSVSGSGVAGTPQEEGLAEYMQLRYVRLRFGESLFTRGLRYSERVADQAGSGDLGASARATIAWHRRFSDLDDGALRDALGKLTDGSAPQPQQEISWNTSL